MNVHCSIIHKRQKKTEKHALTDGYQNVVKPQSVVLFSHKKK